MTVWKTIGLAAAASVSLTGTTTCTRAAIIPAARVGTVIAPRAAAPYYLPSFAGDSIMLWVKLTSAALAATAVVMAPLAAQASAAAADSAAAAPLRAEQLTHYLAVKQALGPYWQAPAHAALLQTAQATGHSHMTPLDEYRVSLSVFDYPTLVAQDTALAALFARHYLAPSEFEPTQVAVAHALRTLMYAEAMGRAAPDTATVLGKNVAVVRAQRQTLEALGLGLPREEGPPPTW